MRQINILPAGCQVYGHSLIFANHDVIYYASTLSIYVYCAKSFVLLKVVAVSDKTLCGLSVVPNDPDLVATVSHDGCMSLWRISDGFLKARVNTQLGSPLKLIFRDLFNMSNIALVASESYVRILSWDTSKITAPLVELFAVKKGSNMQAVAGAWNPHTPNILAVGCNNSWVLLLDTKLKTETTMQIKDRSSSVVDVQWDKLSSIYLIVAYTNFVSLWDTESFTEIQVFERQHHPISGISWLDWTSGNFMTTNSKTGHVRIWNVSQKVPLETFRLSQVGIHSVFVVAGTKSAVAANFDGSLVVYNLFKRQVEFATAAGHTDTVFDCAFDPTSAEVFATSSYDGTVKIWNVSNFSLVRTLVAGNLIIYNCSWSRNGKFIAGSCGTGVVILWEVETGKELLRHQLHSKASYAVAWSKSNDGMFCSTSSDGTLFVVKLTSDYLFGGRNNKTGNSPGKSTNPVMGSSASEELPNVDIVMQYTHPAAVFGCSWSHHHPNLLATGCQDGHVRVFDCSLSQHPLLFDLQGHVKRSFNVIWSMLQKGLVASGSDDATIILWRVDIDSVPINDQSPDNSSSKEGSSRSTCKTVLPAMQLVGHKSNVRAICFSSEHRQLLISGSWDASIRLWDVSTGNCLGIVLGHVADVYSISFHPERPFTYISCSRDTTVRVWELAGVFSTMRATAMVDIGFNRILLDGGAPSASSSGAKTADSEIVSNLLNVMGYRRGGYTEENASSPPIENKSLPVLKPGISGRASLRLHRALMHNGGANRYSDKLQAAECFYRLFGFFCGANGCMDVWEAVLLILRKRQAAAGNANDAVSRQGLLRLPGQRIVFHEDEVVARAFEDATRKSIKRRSVDNEELMLQTAMMQLKCGNFQSFCEMMVSLNDWNAALAVAPRVNIDYWRSLMSQYAEHLQSQAMEQCVPAYLSSGRIIEAADFYLRRREPDNAFFVASQYVRNRRMLFTSKQRSNSSDLNLSDPIATESVPIPRRGSPRIIDGGRKSSDGFYLDMGDDAAASKELEPIQESNPLLQKLEAEKVTYNMVKTVYEYCAVMNTQASRTILAAAYYISAGNVEEAIRLLLKIGEYDLAYAVALCLDQMQDDVLVALAEFFAQNGVMSLGLEILDRSSNPEVTKGLLYAKYFGGSSDQAHTLITQFDMKSPQYWLKKASKEEAIGSDVETVLYNVLGHDFTKAINIGMQALRAVLREPFDLRGNHKRIYNYLKQMRCSEIPESIRISYYSHMMWFAAHEALELNMVGTACAILRLLRIWSSRCVFFLSPNDVTYQELRFKIVTGHEDCRNQLADLKDVNNAKVAEVISRLTALVNEDIGHSALRPTEASAASAEQSLNNKMLQYCDKPTNALRPWTVNKSEIFRECQQLGNILNLPSLARFKDINTSTVINQFVVEGSLLPCGSDWNRPVSCISRKPIVGLGIVIDKPTSMCAGVNEWLEWSAVLPFSPGLDQDTLAEASNV